MSGQERALLKLNVSRDNTTERHTRSNQNEIYERDNRRDTPSRMPPRIIEEAKNAPRSSNDGVVLKIRTESTRDSIVPSRSYQSREMPDLSRYPDYRNTNSRESYQRNERGFNSQFSPDLRFGGKQR